jgi:hypothetical protein
MREVQHREFSRCDMTLDLFDTAANRVRCGCPDTRTEDAHHYIRVKQQALIEDSLRMRAHLG